MSRAENAGKKRRLEFLDQLNKGFKDRVEFYEAPPPGFDPRGKPANVLRRYGLPPEPPVTASRVERDFWAETFTGPLTTDEPGLTLADIGDIGIPTFPTVPRRQPRQNLANAGSRHQRSLNWSGGYVTPAGGGTFVQLAGTWKVPAPELPPRAIPGTDYRSSTWIGLDGQRRHFHSSLPQIGTAQVVREDNGAIKRTYSTWWQWWFAKGNSVDYPLTLKVKQGDRVSALVTVIDPIWVRFVIVNQTTGHLFRVFRAKAPTSIDPALPKDLQIRVSGATAEWVMERPRGYKSIGSITIPGNLYELPDYGRADFAHCYAIRQTHPGSTGRQVHALHGAKFIDMYETRQQPHRTVDVSLGRRETATAIKTTYQPT